MNTDTSAAAAATLPPSVAPSSCDVLVIGGGPAGSTVSALLVERGYSVVLLEKEHHPRFHIGESLLPANLRLFDKLGVASEVAAIGMEKWGIEFVSPWDEERSRFEFAQAWDKTMPKAFQVRRSEFDNILLRNAARKGAQVLEGYTVRDVAFLDGGASARITAVDEQAVRHEWSARMVVDASGRDTFLANKFGAKRKNKKHNSSALFGHFENVERLSGKAEGHTTLFWFDHGWFWFIPLSDGATSIGAVCWPYYLKSRPKNKSLTEFFADTIKLCPPLADRMKNARLLSDVTATGNYSYATTHAQGPGYLLLGDAFAFIDPVFSSGVYLAMNSALVGAELVDARLSDPARVRAATKRFDEVMLHGPRQFTWFIYRVTNPIMRDLFLRPSNKWRVKEAVLSLLAGDIFGKTPIWPSIFLFKSIYRIVSVFNARRAFAAMLRRRVNIRVSPLAEGEANALSAKPPAGR